MHPQHAQRERVVLREYAEPEKGGGNRYQCLRGQLSKFSRPAGGDRTPAHVKDRLMRLLDRLGQKLNLFRMAEIYRVITRNLRLLRVGHFAISLKDILGKID